MSTYYVDPDASGDDDGSSEANAWTTLQRAIDGTDGTQPDAGDVVLCRHGSGSDEIVSTRIDFDGNSGDNDTTGNITYRGVNSSWVNDGTRYVLDANGGGNHIINGAGSDHIQIENFELKDTSGTYCGVFGSSYHGSEFWIFINVFVHGCYDGFDLDNHTWFVMIKCRSESNRNFGIDFYSGVILKSVIKDNTSSGIYLSGTSIQSSVIDCYIYGNGGYGVYSDTYSKQLFSCLGNTIHSNGGDGIFTDNPMLVCGSRITSNATGIVADGTGGLVTALWNYMPDTGEDEVNTAKTSGMVNQIVINGSDSNNFSGTDTDGGYTDPDNDDLNLADTASMRRVEVDLEN